MNVGVEDSYGAYLSASARTGHHSLPIGRLKILDHIELAVPAGLGDSSPTRTTRYSGSPNIRARRERQIRTPARRPSAISVTTRFALAPARH